MGLKLLEVLLQALQLVCRFVICGDGLIDHTEGANDEFQSHRNEAHYSSREAEWVHRRSNGLSGAVGGEFHAARFLNLVFVGIRYKHLEYKASKAIPFYTTEPNSLRAVHPAAGIDGHCPSGISIEIVGCRPLRIL